MILPLPRGEGRGEGASGTGHGSLGRPIGSHLATKPRVLRSRRDNGPGALRPTGMAWVLASELFAGAVGFGVMVHQARRLGPSGFAGVEYASAVAAWLLVIVRGGVDVIAYREAARRPRIVRPLTEILIGLRCAAAVVGYVIVLGMAWLVGSQRGPAVAIAGLLLAPSAFVADVGLRAAGRLRAIAVAQGLKVVGYAAVALLLVQGPADVIGAAWALVAAEFAGAIVPMLLHTREFGLPRPRFRRRAWLVLTRRGAITGLIRFGRVSLYGVDMLALGWWSGAELGTYAAARRLVFGLVALGLVVPASVAPAIARAWAAGAPRARALIADSLARLWLLSIPATILLALSGGIWMPVVFGERYGHSSPWLAALVVARLPWLLSASFFQAALISCRREVLVFDQVLRLCLLALAVVPAGAAWGGPWGVGSAALGIEILAAISGHRMLARLGAAPQWALWGRGHGR